MKKIIFIILMALGVNGFSQGVKFNIGSSYGKAGGNVQNFINGNGQFSFSIGAFHDFKIKGKFYFNPEILFTHNTITYMQKFVLTDASGVPYDYVYQYEPIVINGLELPIQLKLKGKKAYISSGISPYINGYKFDAFFNASAGLLIGSKFSMDIRYHKGLNQIDYGYKAERLTVGFSYLIRN